MIFGYTLYADEWFPRCRMKPVCDTWGPFIQRELQSTIGIDHGYGRRLSVEICAS